MKKYELTLLFDEILEDNVIEAVEKKIAKYATITKIEDDGIKRLAYPIRGHEKARYKFYELDIDGGNWEELSRELNYNTDEVMRFLLVRVDDRKK